MAMGAAIASHLVSSAIGVLSGLLFASVALFWLLYFFIVQVRLADANTTVKDTGWSFLSVRWPVEALAAYRALLHEGERRRWHNRALLHARAFQRVLLLLLIALVATRVLLP